MIASATQVEQPRSPRYRFECDCSDPPILLARYEPGGVVEIKVRERFYYVDGGRLQAVCPKCGELRTLEIGDAR